MSNNLDFPEYWTDVRYPGPDGCYWTNVGELTLDLASRGRYGVIERPSWDA